MKMEKWKECKLGDICNISSSKRIFAEEYVSSGIPFYRGKEIIEKHNKNAVSSELFITHERFAEIKSKFPVPQIDDILLTSVGTLGIPWLVNESNFYFKDGNLTWFRSNTEKVNPKFLYYWFESNYAKNQIDSMCIGSTQKALTIDTLSKFSINLPPLPTQQKIAAILSSLDDKIELNNKINTNLEQQAGALFKNWFLDFAPFGGKMPEEWKVGKLSEIADYLNGLAMQKFRPLEDEEGLPVLKIKELRQGCYDESSELCSPSKVKPEYIIHDGDVIFSWSGSLLVDIWCGGTCGLNQHLFKVTSKTYEKWFYYLWTKHHLDKFIFLAADKATTMGHIKREELDKAEVVISDDKTYQNLTSVIKPFIDEIINNRIENRKLSQIKDGLLPKLMNGEIFI